MKKGTFLLETLSSYSVCLSMDIIPFCEVAAKTVGVYSSKAFCNSCGSIFANKRPSFQWALKNLYTSEPPSNITSGIEQRRIDRYLNIGQVLSNLSIGKKLLDIGSGTGIGLIGFEQLGFDVTGLEPDGRSTALKMHPKIKIINSTIEEFNKKSIEKYDIITLIHVLEHIYNPRDLVEELKGKLHEGGLLYIELPNVENFRFPDIAHVAHVNYFSFKSLTQMLEEFSFSAIVQIYAKTNHFGDVHLGEVFQQKSQNGIAALPGKMKGSVRNNPVDYLRFAPFIKGRCRYVKIITDDVSQSINNYQNYNIKMENESVLIFKDEKVISKFRILLIQFLNNPIFFFKMLLRKFNGTISRDKNFLKFKFVNLKPK